MKVHWVTRHDVIQIIGEYEMIEDDSVRSGLIRVGKLIRGTMFWVTYIARDDNLIVIDVSM